MPCCSRLAPTMVWRYMCRATSFLYGFLYGKRKLSKCRKRVGQSPRVGADGDAVVRDPTSLKVTSPFTTPRFIDVPRSVTFAGSDPAMGRAPGRANWKRQQHIRERRRWRNMMKTSNAARREKRLETVASAVYMTQHMMPEIARTVVPALCCRCPCIRYNGRVEMRDGSLPSLFNAAVYVCGRAFWCWPMLRSTWSSPMLLSNLIPASGRPPGVHEGRSCCGAATRLDLCGKRFLVKAYWIKGPCTGDNGDEGLASVFVTISLPLIHSAALPNSRLKGAI